MKAALLDPVQFLAELYALRGWEPRRVRAIWSLLPS